MDLNIFRDFSLKFDIKGFCQFNTEIELPYYRTVKKILQIMMKKKNIVLWDIVMVL